MKQRKTVLHSLRVVAGFAVGRAVTAGAAGALFGWAPAVVGVLTVEELGALVGAGAGALASTKNLP